MTREEHKKALELERTISTLTTFLGEEGNPDGIAEVSNMEIKIEGMRNDRYGDRSITRKLGLYSIKRLRETIFDSIVEFRKQCQAELDELFDDTNMKTK